MTFATTAQELLTVYTNDVSSKIEFSNNQIADLERQLQELREYVKQLENYQQNQKSALSALQSAIEQVDKASQIVHTVFGDKAVEEMADNLRDRVLNGDRKEQPLLTGGNEPKKDNEPTDPPASPEAETETTIEVQVTEVIDEKSPEIEATEVSSEENQPTTQIDENRLRRDIESWISTEHHKTVRKWASEWFSIDTDGIKIANVRNLIRERVAEFDYDDVSAFWDAVNSPKFNESK